MSTGGSSHPREEKLRALVLGELSESESPTVEAHLAACETCLDRLEVLPTDSPLEQRLRVNAKLPDAAERPVREWLDKLKCESPPAVAEAETDQRILRQLGPPQSPDELGTLGRYRVLAKLGSGGMGFVYEAHRVDGEVRQRVAVKFAQVAPAASARFTASCCSGFSGRPKESSGSRSNFGGITPRMTSRFRRSTRSSTSSFGSCSPQLSPASWAWSASPRGRPRDSAPTCWSLSVRRSSCWW